MDGDKQATEFDSPMVGSSSARTCKSDSSRRARRTLENQVTSNATLLLGDGAEGRADCHRNATRGQKTAPSLKKRTIVTAKQH